jgi:hypothetical protein
MTEQAQLQRAGSTDLELLRGYRHLAIASGTDIF